MVRLGQRAIPRADSQPQLVSSPGLTCTKKADSSHARVANGCDAVTRLRQGCDSWLLGTASRARAVGAVVQSGQTAIPRADCRPYLCTGLGSHPQTDAMRSWILPCDPFTSTAISTAVFANVFKRCTAVFHHGRGGGRGSPPGRKKSVRLRGRVDPPLGPILTRLTGRGRTPSPITPQCDACSGFKKAKRIP